MTVHPAVLGRFFEDFEVGDIYQHPFGRTITEADNAWFTLLTCNTNQMHFNSHLRRRTRSPRARSSWCPGSPLGWSSASPCWT